MNLNRLKSKSILFITEDEAFQEILKNLFQESFQSIFFENNSHQAYENFFKSKIINYEIDLVFIDIHSNNSTLVEKIREENENIPIFITSDNYEVFDCVPLINYHINYAFKKPLDKKIVLEEFYKALRKVAIRKFSSYAQKISAVIRLDVKYNIIYINELFCKISKYSKEELLGKNFDLIQHPSTQKSFYDDMFKNLETQNKWQGVIKGQDKEGNSFSMNSSFFTIRNSNNEIIEYLGIEFNVTQIEESISKLKKYILSQKTQQIQSNKDFDKKINDEVFKITQNERQKSLELEKIAIELNGNLDQIKADKRHLSQKVMNLEDTINQSKNNTKTTEINLKQKIKEFEAKNNQLIKEQEKHHKINQTLSEKLQKAQDGIKVFQTYIDEYRKKIEDLNDVIDAKEKEVKELKLITKQ